MVDKPSHEELLHQIKHLEQAQSEHATIEARLRGTLFQLKSIIRDIPDLVWLKDPQGVYLTCNSRFESFFGAMKKEIVGKTDYDFMDKSLADYFRKNDLAATQKGRPRVNEEEVTFVDDGHHEILETIKTPIYTSDGRLAGVLGIGRDITARKQAEETLRENEARYRRIFENSVVGIFQSTPQGRFVAVNTTFARMLGYASPEELVSSITDIEKQYYVNPADRRRYRRILHQEGIVEDFEVQVRRKDGSKIWISNSTRTIIDETGSVISYEGVVSDITERKHAREERQVMVEVLQLINTAENMDALLHTIIDRLKAWAQCEAVGIRLKEGSDYPYFTTRGFPEQFVCLENHLCSYGEDGRVKRDGQGDPVIECMCGNIIRGEFDPSQSFFTSDGSFWSNCTTDLLATTTDADRQARTRNRCNGYGYESVALIPIRTGNETLGLIQFNDKRKNRFTPDRIALFRRIADSIANFMAKKQAEARIGHLNNILRGIRNVNKLIVHEKDRIQLIRQTCALLVEARGFDSAVMALTDEQGETVLACAEAGQIPSCIRDVLDREKIPECVHQAITGRKVVVKGRFKPFCRDCLGVPETGHDQDTLVVRLNHKERLYGFMMTGQSGKLADSVEERDLLWEMAADIAFALHSLEIENERDSSVAALAATREQFRQAQKMEAVGRLAGGVAHDYNNMLSVIIGYAELALNTVGQENPLHDDLQEILAAGHRSRDITRQLLAFARQQTISPRLLDLNETIESMLKMLRRLIGENIDLSWNPKEGLWPVEMDPSQIDQILANLCVNAKDAITDVGKITIETGKATFDDPYCADHTGFVPGDFVVLAVSDDGCGIDKANLEMIFEPFFTTKGVGRGTGLGLSTVYGIVKQNDGFINVYSEPGKGTTFKIYLPKKSGAQAEDQARIENEIPEGHGELVLVVEDEISTLKLIERMLTTIGYRVLPTNSTTDALQAARERADEIALLITDVVMPEMNGRELAERLQSRYPDLGCLFMSGYTADVIAHRGVLEKGVHFIQKPFSKGDLAIQVRAAIRKSRVESTTTRKAGGLDFRP